MLSSRSAAFAAHVARLIVLPALLLAPATAVAATTIDPATSAPAADAPTSFNRPFFAGVYLGDDGSRTERIDGSLAEYTRMVGKRPALVKTFRTLGEDFSANGWVGSLMRKVSSAGSTNYIALDLRYAGSPNRDLLDAINSGAADKQIHTMAKQMRGLGFQMLVSPGWEMNGRWNNYAWQGHANGAEKGGPAKYAAAFRHIVDIFRREGASNVKWVFSPNVGNAFTLSSSGAAHWNWYGHYYPGDGYVDYLGPHGYNGSSLWGGVYQAFDAMFNGNGSDQLLADMEKRYPSKPIIIGEYATEELRGQDKGQWIARAYETMRRHPNVVGAIWFNMKKETDWRINSSGSALQAYRTAMSDPNVRSEFR
jgi:hypothetical protein